MTSLSELSRGQTPARARHPASAVVKLRALNITKKTSLDDAMAEFFADAYRHWQSNDAAARSGVDVEGVHQVRVALRRFRSGLSLLKRFIPDDQRASLVDETRWLLAELSPVRDLDVFCAALPLAHLGSVVGSDAVATTKRALLASRRVAQARARVALASPRAQRLARRIEAWTSGRGWRLASDKKAKDPRAVLVGDFAVRALNKRILKLLAFGKRIETLPVATLHELRIAVKKARYGVDAFRLALPKTQASKLSAVLKNLQQRLGHLNDLDVATSILDTLNQSSRNTHENADIEKTGEAILDHHRQALRLALEALPAPWQALRKLGSF